ncbi:membrane protein insertase YidC [Pseudoxanthomonas sangjuensis]|uniref:membrane protein insertase YidC n=1 Tax=Pseudoxanthomonas sangjuensis TaxID=1503750 RepID=UPI0013916A3E|nr:membrane protein insertase YidC [Pseudoxanthomonas sangjuensis]KAF1713745.1 membrane protein insertase YidC [Pseudoxanthomonas sangjuensis]
MNQTRVFLFFAWLIVATLLWMEWGKFNAPKDAAAPVTPAVNPVAPPPPTAGATDSVAVPQVAVPVSRPAAALPSAAATPALATNVVTVSTDVLRVVLDGATVLQADLLKYPQSKTAGSPPVRLFASDAEHYYVAQSGWMNAAGNAPTHLGGFVPEQAGAIELQDANEIVVPFVWNGKGGVSIRRTYTFKRGQYAISVRDEVINNGGTPWQGQIYRWLLRKPPVVKTGMTNPESFSFRGAAWYSPDTGYERRKFDKYLEDGKVDQSMQQSWIAMLQHHFFSAWIPQADDKVTVSLDAPNGGAQALVRELGPAVEVAPGQKAASEARLWVGPKLVEQMQAQNVPGLQRAVDYSQFKIFAVIAEGLFWVLSKLHGLFGNWGWAIIGLVVLLKLALFKLSAAQYKSAAKMRKFAPRLQQLKERYGDDRAKYQQAMMELYKKEQINPMAGCLPVIPQIVIFMALYWMLAESVELRQAPWTLWIQDLTARDPYFVLPVLNMAIMWFTQRLTPMTGMDPMQQKMMQFMPLAFGVVLAFLPAGLVLYQVANGGLGLLQQWYMLRKYGEAKPATAAAK